MFTVKRRAWRMVLLGMLWAGCAISQTVAVPACPAPGAPVAEPYRWYPALDLARVPFHAAAGPWGPRAAIAAPSEPVTQRTVHVNSAAQLASEARIPGTRIVVDAAYIGHALVMSDVTDVDIVVPPGRRVAQLTIGRANPPSTTRRVRIRGTTPGAHSGGLIGSITFRSNPVTDVIIDGVDLNGADGSGGSLLWHFPSDAERVAIVNNRGHSMGGGSSLNSGSVNMVIAGNRIMSATSYGIRGGDRIVVYDNRIDGNSFHRVRVHPRPGPPQYAWVANNTFVDPREARIFSAFDVHNQGGRYAAVWAICNRVYAHSTCFLPSFSARDADYAILTSNTFFGSVTEDFQRRIQAAEGGGRDYLSGNTYSAWQAPPAWTAPGDPTVAVPLPSANPIVQPPGPGGKACLPP